MYHFPIGVIINSFRTDTRSAILKAAELGADGIQMYGTKGENSPENLTPGKTQRAIGFCKIKRIAFFRDLRRYGKRLFSSGTQSGTD